MSSAGANAYPPLRFRTQASNSEGSRPDIVGEAQDGVAHLILEGKFWAALTEAQPVGYLQQFPTNGTLMFVCPARRVESLWKELLTACTDAGKTIGSAMVRDNVRSTRIRSHSRDHHMGHHLEWLRCVREPVWRRRARK